MLPPRFNSLPDKSFITAFLLFALLLCALLISSVEAQANPREARAQHQVREQRGQPQRGQEQHSRERPNQEQRNQEQRGQEQRQQSARARISASQAASIVERQYGGKVMSVQTRQANGRAVYSVKILQSSGHMRTVQIDGQSGAILN